MILSPLLEGLIDSPSMETCQVIVCKDLAECSRPLSVHSKTCRMNVSMRAITQMLATCSFAHHLARKQNWPNSMTNSSRNLSTPSPKPTHRSNHMSKLLSSKNRGGAKWIDFHWMWAASKAFNQWTKVEIQSKLTRSTRVFFAIQLYRWIKPRINKSNSRPKIKKSSYRFSNR